MYQLWQLENAREIPILQSLQQCSRSIRDLAAKHRAAESSSSFHGLIPSLDLVNQVKVHGTPSFHRLGSDNLDALSESFSSYMQFKRIRYVDLKWMV